ncbi:hypothetical protein D6C98_06308 [Aureobasidium pullulans]|nr:hypothetical protein D6C98_06308 [Aureobasidium pullulans]
MPEPSQRSSHLSQMTRVDSSDDSFESSYHEDKRTTSVPTKSGTDVALRPHSRSDSLHATSRPSSRASEMTDDINHDDVDLIKKLTATPSAVELDITTRTISKPAADPISEGFNPFKMNAPRSLLQKAQPNQPTQSSQSSQPSQSSQSCQSSQPVPSASFEKSNQEHQSSALSVREERPFTPIPQGLRSIVTWLGSWLTLNLEAPAESREDVQSQLFQTVPSSQIHKAAPRARAPSKGRHRPDRSSVQSQKQCRRRSPVSHGTTIDLSRPDIQISKSPVLKKTVATANHTSTLQPTLESNNVVEETIIADPGPVSVLESDTNDIFVITREAPASPTGVLTAAMSPSPCTEQQHSDIEEEVQVQPEASWTSHNDVVMQDLTSNGLPEDEDLSSVVHAEHPGIRAANFQVEHHLEGKHPLDDEHAGVGHQPVKDQQSTEESQPAEKPQTTPPDTETSATQDTPDDVIGAQQLPTPPDTIPPNQQSLRGVTDRSGSIRVTKKKTKPTPSGLTARKTTSKLRLGSVPYTAAELYQLADFIKEQERVEEKRSWVKELAAKQAELQQASQHNLSLQSECAELKTSLEKYAGFSAKLKTVILAFNGFGHDMKAIQKAKARYDRDFAQLKTQLDTNLDAATKVSDQGLEKINHLRVKSLGMLQDCRTFINALKKDKSDLQRRLDKTSRILAQEKERQAAFDKRLQDLQQEKKSSDETFNGRTSKLSEQLSEFKILIEQGASASATFSREHAESMKKEYATLSESVRSSGTDTEKIKMSIDQLSSGFQKHIEDTKATNTEAINAQAETHTKTESKIVALLEEIRSGFKDREDLAEKNAVLRESISQEKQKLEESTEKVSKLEADMEQKNNDEALLKQKIQELQASQTVLQSEKASAEENKVKLSALTTAEGKLKQDIEKLKSEKAESMAAIASIDEQKKTLQREKAELQGQFKETTKRLEEARSIAPDLSVERTKIEAKAKQQIDEAIAEAHAQARKLAVNFGNQKLRQEKKKEEVDLALVAKENTVRNLQSELERLKQEFGDRSLVSWSDEVKHKDAEIKRLDNESTVARGQVENLQRQLQEALQSIRNSAQEQQRKLDEKDSQINRLKKSNTDTQRTVESLQQELKEATRSSQANDKAHEEDATRKSQEAKDQLKVMETRLSEADSAKRAVDIKLVDLEKRNKEEVEDRQKEIEDLRRILEGANNRVKETEERFNQQQAIIGQKDLDIEKLKQNNAKTAPSVVEVANSQVESQSQGVDAQASTSPVKKARRAVNRNSRSVSKPTSPVTSTEAMQSDVPESTQPRGTGSSIFGPYSKPKASSHHAAGLNDPHQDGDDEMLDMDNSQLQFAKPTSRPGTSQSESRNALSLGSQEILDAEGVRSRPQIRTNFESHSQKSSSSLSEVEELDETYAKAAQTEMQVSQSRNSINASQQQSLGMSALKLNTQQGQNSLDLGLQEQQQSLDLSAQDQQSLDLSAQHESIDSSQPGYETPMKTGRNLQGVGRKLTPRPESQSRSQSKAGALPSLGRLTKGATVSSQQKKVSALSSGPHNFKPGGSGKGKGKRVSYADGDDDDDDDDYAVPSSSGRGSLSPAKRPAAQSTKSNKRVRTEASTSTLSSSQRSIASTPRRSQTTAKSSSQSKASPSMQGAGTPGPPRRRSGRTNKEQNMVSRFNDEIESPRATRRG